MERSSETWAQGGGSLRVHSGMYSFETLRVLIFITYASTIIQHAIATPGETLRDAVMSARRGEAQSPRSN
eukprot:3031615-Prymnesium_polylepis.1